MTVAAVGALWALLSVLAYVLIALLLVGLAVGVPGTVGLLVYQRAREGDLANPIAIGVGAAFFALLIGLFAASVVLVYVG